MQRSELEAYLNEVLQPHLIKDFCPNGLQIQGSEQVNKIVTGVTATEALIDAAIEQGADTLLVHHGYFWKSENPTITGMKYNRIKKLLDHNINLFAYHLPLDVHPELGNNAQLAKRLEIENVLPLESNNPQSVVVRGELAEPISASKFAQVISTSLARSCLHISSPDNKDIKTVAWCTGGGQGYIELAAQAGVDAFISGEASEQTTHVAREMNIHFFAAGHHATERYGAKALGEHLKTKFNLSVDFVDIDNPV
ncbi:Nif3-like dinuclear metal center hexameric protein [Thalassotalea atypica]|uniref:Nif3-like dinuclear metal center hexameric protein n=1 Tax=Thalassotalea atypica TaxID=2054316 RepID=UPI0025741D14|nr:Nif3-like dinuclear metal center hexameric protein [Thalassotalea atypica]